LSAGIKTVSVLFIINFILVWLYGVNGDGNAVKYAKKRPKIGPQKTGLGTAR